MTAIGLLMLLLQVAVSEMQDVTSCVRPGERVLVSIASYGDSPLKYHFLRTILNNLHAGKPPGVQLDVILDLTHDPAVFIEYFSLFPQGMNVSYNMHNPDVKYELAGMYRKTFYAESIEREYYDYFLMVENDMNVSWSHLTYLCEEWKYIFQNNKQISLMPMVMRTFPLDKGGEQAYMDHHFDEINFLTLLPMLEIVKRGGRSYFKAGSPFQAMYFLPRIVLKDLILAFDSLQGKNWTGSPWRIIDKKWVDISAYDIFTGEGRAFFAGLWFIDMIIMAVPVVRQPKDYFIQHMVCICSLYNVPLLFQSMTLL